MIAGKHKGELSVAFKQWIHRFTFQDVITTMRLAKSRDLTLEDCNRIPHVKSQIEKADQWPTFESALPHLRRSAMKSTMFWERRSLTYMFVIHLIGVLCAVAGSLIAVTILESLGQEKNIPKALGLTFFVFLLNISAATLHSQKIEREVLIFWRIRARLVPYLYRIVSGISRGGRYNYKTGDILNIGQTDSTTLASFIAHCFVDIPVLMISVAIIMGALYSFLGSSAWIPLVVILLQIPLSVIFSWLTSLLFREYMNRSDKRISLVTEFIQGMRLVRYFGWGKSFQKEIDRTLLAQFRQEMKISAGFCFAFAQSSYWWMIVSLSVAGGLLYFQEGLSPEKVFGGMWLSSILNQQLTPLPWFISSWASSGVAASRIEALAKEQQQSELISPSVENSLHETQLTGIGYSLRDVSYTFPDSETPVLQNITLDIPPHSKTAIIGPVGAGKSVLSQILLGEIQPDSGSIDLIIETKDSQLRQPLNTKTSLSLLRRYLKWVPQEAFVVSASIRENVPLSFQDQWEGWSDNEIMNALQASQMGPDIQQIPGQLAATLGERGINLSGGQKQRLNLARTHVGDHQVVLLDDPFSAIDKDTEARMAPEMFHGSKTMVWITHRYSFLKEADQIVYLDDGKIVTIETSHKEGPFGPILADFLTRTGYQGDPT